MAVDRGGHMAADEKALTPLNWDQASLDAFEAVVQASPFVILKRPDEMMVGCKLWRYDHGRQAALIATRLDTCSGGNAMHIMGIVASGDELIQTRQLMAAIEVTARKAGANVLSLCTKHTGIARAAGRWGGQITGAIITKKLEGTP